MGRPKKVKQQDLPAMAGPGVAPPKIAAIEKAAAHYVDVRDKRMALTEKEVEARAKLSDAMHAHEQEIGVVDGMILYRYDDMLVSVKPGKEQVKVRRADSPTEAEED